MTELAQVLEGRRAGRADAADRAREQRVAGEALHAVDEEREHAAGVTRRVQAADLEVPDARRHRRRRAILSTPPSSVPPPARGRGRARRSASDRLEVRDMVAVVMGQEHVRDGQSMRSTAATIGSTGPPASIRTALPPARSPTT